MFYLYLEFPTILLESGWGSRNFMCSVCRSYLLFSIPSSFSTNKHQTPTLDFYNCVKNSLEDVGSYLPFSIPNSSPTTIIKCTSLFINGYTLLCSDAKMLVDKRCLLKLLIILTLIINLGKSSYFKSVHSMWLLFNSKSNVS